MSVLNNLSHYDQFLRNTFHADDAGLERLQAEAKQEGLPPISIGPEQGKFLQLLIQLNGATKVLEIGALGGYSGAWMARALPSEGKLISLELEEKHALFTRRQWAALGLADKTEIRVGPALDSLPGLADEAPFDLIFIDADKNNYPAYLEWALRYSKSGTVILGDNVSMGGRLADPEHQENPGIRGMRQFAEEMAANPRLVSTVVPYADGIAVGVVK